jgi:hypothetical protein
MSEGWYADPDDAASLRWWDGTAWTEHRHPVAPAAAAPPAEEHDVVVRVAEGHGMRKPLVATTDRLVIGSETFLLADLDAVEWSAVRSHVNGAYMGTLFSLRVQSAGRKGDVALAPGSRDKRLDELSDAYQRVVWLLDDVVCPRLARDMATRIQAGETITLGPTGARVELSVGGFRLKKPLSKLVPWSRVIRTELEGGRLYFLLHEEGKDEPKRHSMVPLDGANVVVLPHLFRLLSPGGG